MPRVPIEGVRVDEYVSVEFDVDVVSKHMVDMVETMIEICKEVSIKL